MKFRCPYCAHVFEGAMVKCPQCGSSMRVPNRLLGIPFRVRKRAKEKIWRDAERIRATFHGVDFKFGSKPTHIIGLLGVMLLLGGFIITASNGKFRVPEGDPLEATAGREVTVLRAAMEVFKIDCGRYPTEEEGLYALIHNPGLAAWSGPYVNKIQPDPWQRQYRYLLTGNPIRVFSCGPDGEPGTQDDILPSNEGLRRLLGKDFQIGKETP